jgi:mannose-1-phosphate guanylyltransferase / mannose-6-phosphate isomerase
MIQPVILCGGAGTRLWPLSRQAFPKQFVPLIGGKSLLQLTLERVVSLASPEGIVCVGAEEHRFLLSDAMEAARTSGAIILEPCSRNTAAAMTIAALHASSADLLLLFCPADHHIPDVDSFASMVRGAESLAGSGAIVTFGVAPTYPSTAYGYLQRGVRGSAGGFVVKRFIEKPTSDVAQALLLGGDVCWNAGIFLTTAKTLLDAIERYAPDILASCRETMRHAEKDGMFVRPEPRTFASCRSASIDYAVMEHHSDVRMVPFDGAWSDVGSWNAVADLTPPDVNGNRLAGKGLAIDSRNTYIHAPHRQIVALGTQDLLIIDTPDALLVAARSAAEEVKAVVSELVSRNSPEAGAHRKVARPWGSYDTIQSGERFQVKRLSVKPGASLSLQLHHHRAEHWVVVRGTAEVTKGEQTFLLTENESTYIRVGELHRLHNPGRTALEMIEIQSGSYLEEDDIVRFDDDYGRVVVPIKVKNADAKTASRTAVQGVKRKSV